MGEERPERRRTRLRQYDYNRPGYYFITICTVDRRNLLSRIVGTGVPDGPKNQLTEYGRIADKHLQNMGRFYDDIVLDMYVIMPNHVHLLIQIKERPNGDGPSGTPVPTIQNSRLSQFLSTFKRFCNKEYGENIWQYRSYDHIIRDRDDYIGIAKYIQNNPKLWHRDCFYTPS